MTTFDLYAINTDDLKNASVLVERVLSISLESRESTYQGGNYFLSGNESGEHFVLKKNLDPFDDEPVEQAFPEVRILLYVNDTQRQSEIQDALVRGGSVLLRREEL
jgi:hypothetical protein